MTNRRKGRCRSCMSSNKEKKICNICLELLPQGSYTRRSWEQCGDDKRACRSCVEKEVGYWKCKECAQRKPEDEFAMCLSVNAKKSTNGKQYCDECAKKTNFSNSGIIGDASSVRGCSTRCSSRNGLQVVRPCQIKTPPDAMLVKMNRMLLMYALRNHRWIILPSESLASFLLKPRLFASFERVV